MNSKNILALSLCLLSMTSFCSQSGRIPQKDGKPGSGSSNVVSSLFTYIALPIAAGIGSMAIDRITNLGAWLRLPKSKADAELEKTQARLAESEKRTVIDILNEEEAQVSEKTKAKYKDQNTSLTQEEQAAITAASQLQEQQQQAIDSVSQLQAQSDNAKSQIAELQALIAQNKTNVSGYQQNAKTYEQQARAQLQQAQIAKQQRDQLAEQENSELHASTTQFEILRQSLLKLVGATDKKTANLEEVDTTETETSSLKEVGGTDESSSNPESRRRSVSK